MTQLKEIQRYQCYDSQKLKFRINLDQRSHTGFTKKKIHLQTIERMFCNGGIGREMCDSRRMGEDGTGKEYASVEEMSIKEKSAGLREYIISHAK